MPVPKTSRVKLEDHLATLGVNKGMHLAVHSRLISFGRLEGGVATALNTIAAAIGSEGTLVLPSYTMNLTADEIYDPATTPSHAMGGLSEYARTETDAQRTLCPMHGHLVMGAKAEAIMSADPNKSMGPGSAFNVMEREGFHLLLLGCNFQEGATYVHHAESIKGVPYRKWFDIPRRVRSNDGSVSDVACRYYGRKPDSPWDTNLSAVENQSRKLDFSNEVSIHGRSSHLMALDDLNNCIFNMLDQDPFALMQAIADN